ncbi:hypothetical protein MMC09_002559 [Bachmanniomyces sp. S44760]|nr:hypothetical protein [Bachmanniomyces sp. S44760]
MIVGSNEVAPKVLVGTLSVTCIAVLYVVITYILFLDNILPFLLNTAMDGFLLIAVVVVAVTIGKPLSYLNCQLIGSTNADGSAYDFTTSLGASIGKYSGELTYSAWIGVTKSTCLEMKAIWGLSIALCVLFTFSMICSVCLWRRSKAFAPLKDIEK